MEDIGLFKTLAIILAYFWSSLVSNLLENFQTKIFGVLQVLFNFKKDKV